MKINACYCILYAIISNVFRVSIKLGAPSCQYTSARSCDRPSRLSSVSKQMLRWLMSFKLLLHTHIKFFILLKMKPHFIYLLQFLHNKFVISSKFLNFIQLHLPRSFAQWSSKCECLNSVPCNYIPHKHC